MLELTSISKTFYPGTVNERRALDDISLALAPGDFVTVIGSNGAGKSTLLNVVGGRYGVDSGRVAIDGHDVTKLSEPARAGRVARVFQDPMVGTAPHLTIEENLALALRRGQSRGLGTGISRARKARFRDELTTLELGLEDRLTTKVGMLSGGQRQALSLLMATFVEPKVLLLDEHTAALDPQRSALVMRLTKDAIERHRLTTLMVTHNMTHALEYGNRLVMMHEGRIVLELDGQAKRDATVEDLLDEFAERARATLSDRALLS
ncbi:MAG TPA: ABC transporter ATP-binding protein [Candidatus Luteococcus avicola]|uniref:ABC transporter ATP-binding protein n=1 Tax=Luteococcus sanguinis TaxID=174038 RepID=A0ABW1X0D2_9ACTN|nr:ABC transporter ATP-binding protein [Candidatus Luteococcus avicola]